MFLFDWHGSFLSYTFFLFLHGPAVIGQGEKYWEVIWMHKQLEGPTWFSVLPFKFHDNTDHLISKILRSVEARKARFPSLQQHCSTIPVFFSLHVSTITLPSFLDRKTTQNSKNKPENLRWTLFWLHCSNCLELAASRPESLSLPPNFQS